MSHKSTLHTRDKHSRKVTTECSMIFHLTTELLVDFLYYSL